MKVLLAVDGSQYSLDAVDWLIAHAGWYRAKPTVELLTVHLPVPKLPRMGYVVSKAQIARYYQEEGAACLAGAQKKLGAAGIAFKSRILVGRIAETIVAHAGKTRCQLILIGTHGRGAAAGMLMGSVATRVVHIATLPVLLVK